jgi:hypothetical protein
VIDRPVDGGSWTRRAERTERKCPKITGGSPRYRTETQ